MNLTAGKWYRWTGGEDRPSSWNEKGVETDAPVQKDEVSSDPLTICTSDVLAELFAKL